MKKGFILFLAILMCGMLMLPVGAAESDALPDGHFATAADLFGYWESTYPPQYPDYICGVWTDNGTSYPLTFSVTDNAAGRAGKKEILRLLADDQSVKFTTDRYSRNFLMQVMEEITPYFSQDLGLAGLGVYDMDNHVGLEILQSYADREETKQFLKDLKKRYGDAVSISYTGGYVTHTTDLDSLHTYTEVLDGAANGSKKMVLLFTLVGLGLLGTTAAVALIHRKKTAVAQTTVGTVTAAFDHKPTCREVETAIKNSESSPSPSLEDKINAELDR